MQRINTAIQNRVKNAYYAADKVEADMINDDYRYHENVDMIVEIARLNKDLGNLKATVDDLEHTMAWRNARICGLEAAIKEIVAILSEVEQP